MSAACTDARRDLPDVHAQARGERHGRLRSAAAWRHALRAYRRHYDSGFYASATDPLFLGAANAGNIYQPRGDGAFIVNGTLALADIDVGEGGARVTLSVWSRNLLNEQHVSYKSLSLTSGLNGFFNEPRTLGGQVQVKF